VTSGESRGGRSVSAINADDVCQKKEEEEMHESHFTRIEIGKGEEGEGRKEISSLLKLIWLQKEKKVAEENAFEVLERKREREREREGKAPFLAALTRTLRASARL